MLCWDVFGVLSSGRGDDTNRRTFQPRYYRLAHASTECVVHCKVSSMVRCERISSSPLIGASPAQTAKPSARSQPTALPYPPTYRSGTASLGCRNWAAKRGCEVRSSAPSHPSALKKRDGPNPDRGSLPTRVGPHRCVANIVSEDLPWSTRGCAHAVARAIYSVRLCSR